MLRGTRDRIVFLTILFGIFKSNILFRVPFDSISRNNKREKFEKVTLKPRIHSDRSKRFVFFFFFFVQAKRIYPNLNGHKTLINVFSFLLFIGACTEIIKCFVHASRRRSVQTTARLLRCLFAPIFRTTGLCPPTIRTSRRENGRTFIRPNVRRALERHDFVWVNDDALVD